MRSTSMRTSVTLRRTRTSAATFSSRTAALRRQVAQHLTQHVRMAVDLGCALIVTCRRGGTASGALLVAPCPVEVGALLEQADRRPQARLDHLRAGLPQ